MSRPRVVIDLAEGPKSARDLAAGGIFVAAAAITQAGCDLELDAEFDLVVRGSTGELTVPARIVFVAPANGAGVELVGFGPAMKEQLAQLGTAVSTPAPAETQASADEPLELLDLALPDEPPPATTGNDATDDAADDDSDAPDDADDDDAAEGTARKKLALNIHERLRGLTHAQQLKAAASNDPTTRMTLERLYGKNVWEALLRNGRLTAPEVARLARMGTMPRPLIEIIVGNGAWLQIAEVRRALLSNPRLGTDQIMRVLRLMPKNELKVAATMMAYPSAVRDAAKRILKEA